MDPIIIARTEPRERMEVDHGTRWTEYRLRDAQLYNYTFVVEMRHIRTVENGGQRQITEEDWQLWQGSSL